jgi:putative membrane protein
MKTDHRIIWTVLGVLVLVVLLGPLLAGGMMGPGMMGGYGLPGVAFHGSGWLWGLGMGLGGLVMLAFWGALIAGGIVLVRWLFSQAHAGDDRGGENPLAILRRRYAAGEIDQATYERMKQELGGTAEWVPGSTSDASRTNGQGGEAPVLPSRGRPEPQ